MTIGQSMKAARLRAGMSAQRLADDAKISVTTLRHAERDDHGMNIYLLYQLADVLKIGIDEYIGRKIPE